MLIEIYKGYRIKENTISGKTKGQSYYAIPRWGLILYGSTVKIVENKIDRLIKKGDLDEKP